MNWIEIIGIAVIAFGIIGYIVLLAGTGFTIESKSKGLIIDEPNYPIKDWSVSLDDYDEKFTEEEIASEYAAIKEKFQLDDEKFDAVFKKVSDIVHSNADKKLGQIKKLVGDGIETFDEGALFRYLFKLAIMDNKKME
jgi:hypothetical protein